MRIVDKSIESIESVMPYSPIIVFLVCVIFIMFVSKYVYSQRGRIWTDIVWLISGSIAIFMTGLGIQYEATLYKTRTLYDRAFEFRQRIGHEATYINQKWCGKWKDSPVFFGDKDQLKDICETTGKLRDASFSMGIQYNTGFYWENIPLYKIFNKISSSSASSYADIQLTSEFGRVLTYYVSQYDSAAQSLRDMAPKIRLAVFIKFMRLVFIHIAAAAAALRIGRAVFELRQK